MSPSLFPFTDGNRKLVPFVPFAVGSIGDMIAANGFTSEDDQFGAGGNWKTWNSLCVDSISI